jgi:hypothetical protein
MDFKIIEGNLYITKSPTQRNEIVSFEEVSFDNMNCIRVFPTNDPDQFKLQLRAKQPLRNRQKERNVVATVQISVEELEEILSFMKAHQHEHA